MILRAMENTDRDMPGDLASAILHTAAYADVFDYPLTAKEIHRYLTGLCATAEQVEQLLQEGAFLSRVGEYYMLPAREMLADVRRRREQISNRLWPKALGYGRIAAGIPFVRMLAVTGSLAMNNVENNPDIDYLVVTAPGRLWTVRAMLLALARMAALHGVRICPNYLVTERAMVFPDQTLYAAHELAQMVPLFGMHVYAQLCSLNRWKDRFLPNAQGLPPVRSRVTRRNDPMLKPALESLLLKPPSGWFEQWEMARKMPRLKRQQSSSPESTFTADTCKGHDQRHAQRTEETYRKRLENFHLELHG